MPLGPIDGVGYFAIKICFECGSFLSGFFEHVSVSKSSVTYRLFIISAFYLAIDSSPLFIAESLAFLLLCIAFENDRDGLPCETVDTGESDIREAVEDSGISKASRKSDIAMYVLSGALLVALGAAALYGWHYGNVDESVAPGHIDVHENSSLLLVVDINDDMTAKVAYLNRVMTGKFVLAGAEEDSILFQLKNIKFEDGSDSSDAVFFLRLPRTGLQGDYAGPWMTYFSCPSQGAQYGNWVIAREDGSASVGARDKLNAITAQRYQLLEWSSVWTWVKGGDAMRLNSVMR